MPKTYKNLWEGIIGWDNLYTAYLEARKRKRYKAGVLRFNANLEENITNIQNHLMWGSWRPSKWKEFMVYEPKRRLIQAPPFKDRVVHHALASVISPLFERKFIFDSYACRQGKGFHQAAKRVQTFLQKARVDGETTYVLKADISKYFHSIDHDALSRIFSRTIRDERVLALSNHIIRDAEFDKCGIPLGSLTSQIYANIYLDQLDHYVKDTLGVKYYCRFMDDFIIVCNDKKYLWLLLSEIEHFLTNKLKLTLNPKTAIFPSVRGVDFCGYRVWVNHILPRKKNIRRARRSFAKLTRAYSKGEVSLEKVKACIMSFLGYTKHCNSYITTQNILNETILRRSKCKSE